MLCTSQPLAKGDLIDHILHTFPMYKDCLGIMKEQCKNSRFPHLLMIVVHEETLWSPAQQPMDDDESNTELNYPYIGPKSWCIMEYGHRSILPKKTQLQHMQYLLQFLETKNSCNQQQNK